MRFEKKVQNLIQMINDYNVVNKYDLTWQTHFMPKYINQNIIDEGIIITLKNWSLKGYVKPLMTFLIFEGS